MKSNLERLAEDGAVQGSPSRDPQGLWVHPYPQYVPDPRKKKGIGAVDWYQQVVGLPGGVGFAAEDDNEEERRRVERDTWGVANGQDPDEEEDMKWGFSTPMLGNMTRGFKERRNRTSKLEKLRRLAKGL